MNRKTIARSLAFRLALGLCNLASLPTLAAEAHTSALTPKATPQTLARGKYLVTVGACNDCHTPFKLGPNGPEPDISRMLSGHPEGMPLPPPPQLPAGPWLVTVAATNTAWSGPWGVSFTANLTPDDETGLGKWSLQDFRDTLRSGRHMGRGRPILPPMPVAMYRHFTDQDMAAIYAYLRSIPPVRNAVPEPLPPLAAK